MIFYSFSFTGNEPSKLNSKKKNHRYCWDILLDKLALTVLSEMLRSRLASYWLSWSIFILRFPFSSLKNYNWLSNYVLSCWYLLRVLILARLAILFLLCMWYTFFCSGFRSASELPERILRMEVDRLRLLERDDRDLILLLSSLSFLYMIIFFLKSP